jgi:hypothetical protein
MTRKGPTRVALAASLALSLLAIMALAFSLTPAGVRTLSGLANVAGARAFPWAPVVALADTTCTPPPNTSGGGTSPPPNTSGGGTRPPPNTSGGGTSPPPNTSGGGTSPPPNTSGGGTSPPPNTSGGGTSPPPNTSGGGICPPPTPPPTPTPTPSIGVAPPTAINPVETNHTVTATVTVNGQPAAGVTVQFTVTNTATSAVITTGSCVTNASGQCTFTYAGPSTLTPRSDTIKGCATTAGGTACATATKTWVVTCEQRQQQFLNDITALEAAGEEPPSDLVKQTLDDLFALLKAGCQLPPLPCAVDSDNNADWQGVMQDWATGNKEMETDAGELAVDAFLAPCEPDEDDGHQNGNEDRD